MVLSTPAADPGAAQARAWLAKLIQPLELSRGGILLCLRDATPTQLGPVVWALSGAPPWAEEGDVLEVCLRASEVLDVAPGSRVLLRVRTEDLDWLNIARPLFAERELRTILWADAQAFDGLIRRAVDFFDWVTRVVQVPAKAVPDFAVAALRAQLPAKFGPRGEFAWAGAGWAESLEAAGGEPTVGLHVEEPYLQLISALRAETLALVSGVGSARDAWRVRMALALAESDGGWVALDPEGSSVGLRALHAQQADWDEASAQLRVAGWRRPALVAAWLDLEPERIAAAVDHVGRAPPPAPAPRLARQDESREGRLLRSIRGIRGDTPSIELVEEAEQAGFPEVAMSLALVRWRLGADERADRLVERLLDEGETQTAREVVESWGQRASASNDSASLAARDRSLEVIESISEFEPRAEPAPELPSGDDSDRELLERWRAGDRGAGNSLVTRHYEDLGRYLRTKVPAADALDLLQEIFSRMSQAAMSGSVTTNFRAYLYRTAYVVLTDYYRQRHTSQEFERAEQHQDLLECLQALPYEAQSLIELYYWEGLSFQELAEVLGVSPAAVRKRLHLARQRLAARIGDADLASALRAGRAGLRPTRHIGIMGSADAPDHEQDP